MADRGSQEEAATNNGEADLTATDGAGEENATGEGGDSRRLQIWAAAWRGSLMAASAMAMMVASGSGGRGG